MQKRVHGNLFVNDKSGECIVNECIGIEDEFYIKNYNNLTSYYARYLNTRIYFVPFYFEVKYTDLDNCVDDKANNSSRYDDYEIVDTYWK